MVVVDTSFLVALHFSGDRFHREAIQTQLAGDRFLVPSEIWGEFADVAMRLSPPKDLPRLLASACAGPFDIRPVFEADEYARLAEIADRVRGLAARTNRRPLSFFDVVVCSAAARFREGILTFDEGMAQAVKEKLFPGARLV